MPTTVARIRGTVSAHPLLGLDTRDIRRIAPPKRKRRTAVAAAVTLTEVATATGAWRRFMDGLKFVRVVMVPHLPASIFVKSL
jgi:hypothetical protein